MNELELEKIISSVVDNFSIHRPKGVAKGTLARRVLKKQLLKALKAQV